MSINQINPELNDAFEIYYPKMGIFRAAIFKLLTKLVQVGIRIRRGAFSGKLILNERIVEYPLIIKWLNPDRSIKILDIGCWSSRLPIQLASLGYEVHGLDVQEYGLTHPNFRFHRDDMFKWSPENKFDAIISISVIEHFGIGGYGDSEVSDGDIKAVDRMAYFLKKGGQLLVSMPFGKGAITPKHRIYDYKRLKEIFKKFDFIEEAYFKRDGKNWQTSTKDELAGISSFDMPVNGVVILNLKLKEDFQKSQG